MIINTYKSREHWFDYPCIREKMILGARRLREGVTDREVVEAIMNTESALVIPYTYRILPEELRKRGGATIETPSSTAFKKHGKAVYLTTPETRFKAIDERTDPQELMSKRFNNVQMGDRLRGYAWRAISSAGGRTQRKLVRLASALDGYSLYVFFEVAGPDVFKTKGLPQERITYRDYQRQSYVTLPSRTRDKRHYVRLDGLPTSTMEMHADWTEISAESSSEDKIFTEVSDVYATPETVFDDHTVAAYRMVQEGRGMKGAYPDPFAIPGGELVRYNDAITNYVVVEHRFDGRNIRKNPTEAEREILLWKLAGYQNMRSVGGEKRAFQSLFRRDYEDVADYMVKIL